MDSLTHAVTGAVALLAIPSRPSSRWAIAAAAAVTSLPDIDVFFARTPLEFLLLHRGITHALLALPFLALPALMLLYPLWRRNTPGHWSLGKTYCFALALLLLHTGLDCATTYGTMIFLPFSEFRVRLNGMFIVDFLLLIPLLAACFLYRRYPRCMVAALLWILVYPCACIALRIYLQQEISARLLPQGVQEATLLPDAFSPFRWRLLYKDSQQRICRQGVNWRGIPTTAVSCAPAVPLKIQENLSKYSRNSKAFLAFSLFPLLETGEEDGQQEWRIYDWRFGSEIPAIRALMRMRANGETPFLLRVRPDTRGKAQKERLTFSGASKDSPWLSPDPPDAAVPWYRWLLGLR